jgi:hypothetical protein
MGIILLPVGALVIGLYFWAVVKGTRWAYRKTHSIWAIAGVLTLCALIPTWDTLANRIYHKQVICKKPEIGLHVFEKIRLPGELYDARGIPLILDRYGNFNVNKMGNRYKQDGKYANEGGWLTGVVKYTFEINDVQSGRVLARFTDFYAAGGGWILIPFRPLIRYFGEYAFRGEPKSCLDFGTNWIGETVVAPFLEKNRAN